MRLGIFGLLLVSCAVPQAVDPDTATAVAQQVVLRATEMAAQHQRTFAATEENVTATQQALLAKVHEWPVYFADNFDDDNNENEWPLGEADDPSLGVINQTIDAGKYLWSLQSKDGLVWWSYPNEAELTDFYVRVQVRQVSGAENGWMGLLLRKNDDENYYLFKIENDGFFTVERWLNNEWTTLIDWTESGQISAYANHLLEVYAEGGHFMFMINGEMVAEMDDTFIPSGVTGVFVGLTEGEQEGVFEFDDFEVRVPDPGSLEP